MLTTQGTTFSGVAFAFATNTEAKEDIITEWPGAGNQTKQKVGAKRDLRKREDMLTVYYRFLPFSTTTSTRRLSAGVLILLMRLLRPDIPSRACRRWNGSSSS